MKINSRLMDIYLFVQWKVQDVINYVRYDIPQGMRSLIIYSPLIWRTREWDYIFLYEMIVFKLKQMEDNFTRFGVTTDRNHMIKQIQIARTSLERIVKDEYPAFMEFGPLTKEERDNINWGPKFAKDVQMQKDDLERFTDYFKKYSFGWWD
jgi:hypothetical protein